MLAFHPKFTSTLLVSSSVGVISLIDAQLNAFQQTMQVMKVVQCVQLQVPMSSNKIILPASGLTAELAHERTLSIECSLMSDILYAGRFSDQIWQQ